MGADPKCIKKTVKLSIFFTLSGSLSVKAVSKTLVKLTRAVNFINILCARFSYKIWYQTRNITRKKDVRTKNAGVKPWWNWHKEKQNEFFEVFENEISGETSRATKYYYENNMFVLTSKCNFLCTFPSGSYTTV
jgi:hypothetical protein